MEGDLLNVIRKDRVVDDSLKRQIDTDRLHICERHFNDYQFYFYATRRSLKEGAIPTLNLPQKAIPPITSPHRPTITITKHEVSSATQVLPSSALFYKDFLQFKQRIVKRQINDTCYKSSRQLCNINILNILIILNILNILNILIRRHILYQKMNYLLIAAFLP